MSRSSSVKSSISSAKNVSSTQVTSTWPTSFKCFLPRRSIVHCRDVALQPASSCAPPAARRRTRDRTRPESQGCSASRAQARARRSGAHARGAKEQVQAPQNITRPEAGQGRRRRARCTAPLRSLAVEQSEHLAGQVAAIRPTAIRGAALPIQRRARAGCPGIRRIARPRIDRATAAISLRVGRSRPRRRRHDQRPRHCRRAARACRPTRLSRIAPNTSGSPAGHSARCTPRAPRPRRVVRAVDEQLRARRPACTSSSRAGHRAPARPAAIARLATRHPRRRRAPRAAARRRRRSGPGDRRAGRASSGGYTRAAVVVRRSDVRPFCACTSTRALRRGVVERRAALLRTTRRTTPARLGGQLTDDDRHVRP